jgi:cathepsin A (carboxypeptidase C)
MIDDILISDYINIEHWDYDSSQDDTKPSDPKVKPTNPDDSEPIDHNNIVEEYTDNLKLYFLMAESRSNPDKDPLIIWLQGGPGCSSMLGLYTENGPYNFRFDKDHIKDPFELVKNNFSWNNAANVMYIDQPIGTGFSFTDSWTAFRMTEDQVAEDFYIFLHNFLHKYPKFQGREIFLTGESYAGHYIPVIARTLQLKDDPWINLGGLAIGNGWVDPFY